jgi:HlyD family secretion protein
MNRKKILIGTLLLLASMGLLIGWWKANTKQSGKVGMVTELPVRMDVINKRVISGKLVPHKEVELKTTIAGVLEEVYVAIGDKVSQGTPIARIKVLPKASDIESAKKALYIAQATEVAAKKQYQRSKQLFEKNMLSPAEDEQETKAWKIARAEASYAKKKLDFVQKGRIAGAKGASNIIKSTIAGVVSELPCKEGGVVMEHSSFKEGSTVATISDMRVMLFQGKVGEMDVAHLHTGMQFDVTLTPIQGKKFLTILTKVAPKALEDKKEQSKSVKFEIEGTVQFAQEERENIRAGYTAMADIVLEQAMGVLAIKEQAVHTEDPAAHASAEEAEAAEDKATTFVWVYAAKKRVKKYVVLGVSNGIYVAVKEGLEETDQVIIADDSH